MGVNATFSRFSDLMQNHPVSDRLLSVVVPAYNEAENIGRVLAELADLGPDVEIIVVDDGSRDDTAAIVAEHRKVKLLRHARNQGYGAALKTGFNAARGTYVITLDADGQHDPLDAYKMMEKVPEFDLVVGQRSTENSGFFRKMGRRLLRRSAVLLTGYGIPDLNSGMKLYKRELFLPLLDLCPDNMSFSDSILMVAIASRFRIGFCPIQVRSRAGGSSTVNLRTAADTLLTIVQMAVVANPLRVFSVLGALVFTLGVLWGTPFLILGRGLSVVASTLILLSVMLLVVGLVSQQILTLFRLNMHMVRKIYEQNHSRKGP